MMMRRSSGVLEKMVQMVIMTTIVQFSCNLLLPLHCDCGTLGKRLQEARFPAGSTRLSLEFPVSSPATTARWQQVANPRCDLSLRIQASRVSRLQIPVSDSRLRVPGSDDPGRDPDQNCGGRRRQECHEPGHQPRNSGWRHP